MRTQRNGKKTCCLTIAAPSVSAGLLTCHLCSEPLLADNHVVILRHKKAATITTRSKNIRQQRLRRSRHYGFTLIEVLIVMALLIVIFAAIWGIIETFSKSFVRGEIRAERSQLVRSLSQLVTDDLGCAIQDPLHPARESNITTVRRFGLSGTNTSMRIDVMQINPFRTGSMLPQSGVQAPELKTVYYDFAMFSTNGGGLTRRELDFETPTGTQNTQTQSPWAETSGNDLNGDFGDADALVAIDSDSPSLADYSSGTSLVDSASVANESYTAQQQASMMTPEEIAIQQAARNFANEQLQLEMSAPEVVGCRFRYYDGSQWHDNWNSLDRKGLPVAIEITLKLMPLVDARTLRESPLALQVVDQPSANSITAANNAAYAQQMATQRSAMSSNTSDMTTTGGMSSSLGDFAGGASLADYGESPSSADMAMQQNMLQRQPVGLTAEQLALQLELPPPTEQRIIVRVPTTPLGSQKELQREQPKPPPQTSRTAEPPRRIEQRTVQQPQRVRPQTNRNNQPQSPDWIRQ
jgi:prepilin-type N-terminal cleavage/methylation domain